MADRQEREHARGWERAAELLLEHGEYAPLELLIRLGRLGYADYEAWRRGDGAPLASRLRGNPERIAALLEGAAAYCRARGLEHVTDEWTAWGAPDQELQLAQDPQWRELLAGRYRVPATRTQLDLFEDAGATVLERDAADALSRGAPEAAEQAVAALAERCPDHPRLGAYQRLASGLQPPASIDDPAAYLDAVLEALEPAATEVLGAGARDFLAPHWRALTDALAADQPFDPGRPRLHASYTAARAADWEAVHAAVLAEPGWGHHPVLIERLLEAARHRGDRDGALAAAARLCWDHPEDAERVLPGDERLGATWQAFADSDPELATADFPAWCLLFRGWRLPALEAGTVAHAEALETARAADAVVAARQEDSADEGAARRRLQTQRPELLEQYLAHRAAPRR